MADARTLTDIARQLISDIDEMYSTKLSAAQYDTAIAKVLAVFDAAAPLTPAYHRAGRIVPAIGSRWCSKCGVAIPDGGPCDHFQPHIQRS